MSTYFRGKWTRGSTLVDQRLHMNQEPKVVTENSSQALVVFRPCDEPQRTSGGDHNTALGPQ